MPDPARPILLIASGLIISFITCIYLSASLRLESDKQRRVTIGFSNKNIGALLFVISGGVLFSFGCFSLIENNLFLAGTSALYISVGLLFPFTLGYLFSSFFNKYLAVVINPFAQLVGATIGLLLSLPSRLLVTIKGPGNYADITEEDLLSAVDSAEEQDFIDETQREMIANIFELDDITAGDAMTHRTDVFAIEENIPAIDAIRLSMEEGISRIPVYRKTLDDILGIVYVKDLFSLLDSPENREKPVADFMRSVMYIPEAAKARELLVEFKKKHTQIAIVVDEYGGTSGLVTMEDILEEIVGDMQDEFDDEEDLIHKIDDSSYLCDGSVDIEDVFELFELPVPEEYEDESFESIGGLMIEKLGRIPENGEQPEMSYGGIHFKVMETGERRIQKVLCTKILEDELPDDTL